MFSTISWARLQAMLSSFKTEMPTSTGVFPSELSQPFMPVKLEQKLVKATKVWHFSDFTHQRILIVVEQLRNGW